jgi:hypothetical protein
MKTLSACLAALAILLLAALYLQYSKVGEQAASLAALNSERDTMKSELDKLKRQVTELRNRPEPLVLPAARAESAGAQASSAPSEPPAPIVPVERPGVTIKAPAGWFRNGAKADNYVVGVDSNETWGGMPSAYVQSLTPSVEGGFGGMMQTTAAENYLGKRVRLSGWIKTENAEQGGQLWLRVDGQERNQVLQFDNMDNRSVKGTKDWQEASVVLDVPAGARALAYGFFVKGGGKMWVSGQQIQEVGLDVPSTNMVKPPVAPPTAPRNLGFDPKAPK